MAQSPLEPTSLDKILRAVGAVRTKGGIAALDLILVFCFGSGVLFIGKGMDISQVLLTAMIFICWQGLTVYFFIKLPQSQEFDYMNQKPIALPKVVTTPKESTTAKTKNKPE